jgi:hypothetical protein
MIITYKIINMIDCVDTYTIINIKIKLLKFMYVIDYTNQDSLEFLLFLFLSLLMFFKYFVVYKRDFDSINVIFFTFK